MEKYMQVFSNDSKAMMRVPIDPDFMMWSDTKNKKGWIVIKDTPENISLFNDKYGHLDIPEGYKVYYNEPYYYDLIADGVDTRHRIKEEKERQARLDNPQVWQEVKDIETKEQLIEYFMDYWYSTNHSDIWEYSSDLEVDDIELTETAKELNEKIKELL